MPMSSIRSRFGQASERKPQLFMRAPSGEAGSRFDPQRAETLYLRRWSAAETSVGALRERLDACVVPYEAVDT